MENKSVNSSSAGSSGPAKLILRNWGRQKYRPMWQRMLDFTDRRNGIALDELWLVEHDPVFTLGKAGSPEHLLNPGDIEVVHSDRGGQVTYHGPGQLVVYPLIDLQRRGLGIKAFVSGLEQTIIDTLARFEIVGCRVEGAPGVYVDGDKIAALGLRVRRGCSLHGVSLNVSMNLKPFERINPCGNTDLKVVQIADFCADQNVTVAQVADVFIENFARQFNYNETEWQNAIS